MEYKGCRTVCKLIHSLIPENIKILQRCFGQYFKIQSHEKIRIKFDYKEYKSLDTIDSIKVFLLDSERSAFSDVTEIEYEWLEQQELEDTETKCEDFKKYINKTLVIEKEIGFFYALAFVIENNDGQSIWIVSDPINRHNRGKRWLELITDGVILDAERSTSLKSLVKSVFPDTVTVSTERLLQDIPWISRTTKSKAKTNVFRNSLVAYYTVISTLRDVFKLQRFGVGYTGELFIVGRTWPGVPLNSIERMVRYEKLEKFCPMYDPAVDRIERLLEDNDSDGIIDSYPSAYVTSNKILDRTTEVIYITGTRGSGKNYNIEKGNIIFFDTDDDAQSSRALELLCAYLDSWIKERVSVLSIETVWDYLMTSNHDLFSQKVFCELVDSYLDVTRDAVKKYLSTIDHHRNTLVLTNCFFGTINDYLKIVYVYNPTPEEYHSYKKKMSKIYKCYCCENVFKASRQHKYGQFVFNIIVHHCRHCSLFLRGINLSQKELLSVVGGS